MIYLFYGSDAEKTRAKAFEWVAKARAKEPNLAYIRLAREEISPASLQEAAQSGSLFAKRTLTLIDDPFPAARKGEEDEPAKEPERASTLEEHVDELAASENAIVILAPKLAAARAKKLIAKAKLAYEFNLRAQGTFERGFNSALVNALAARDRATLWLETVRAVSLGDAPEAVHGLLHWKARDLMEKGSRSWKPAEARSLSLSLITLLQESRRTGADLSRSLERFALSV